MGRQASSARMALRERPSPMAAAHPVRRLDSAPRARLAGFTPSPALWRMAYYSCPGLMIRLSGGPSGIRTHDLLNAIETRSQLRYGPSGPGGVRTRDLFSAIEARSQLRSRPPCG